MGVGLLFSGLNVVVLPQLSKDCIEPAPPLIFIYIYKYI